VHGAVGFPTDPQNPVLIHSPGGKGHFVAIWPNGADFDPETLHEWPKYVQEIERIARRSEIEEIKVI